MSTRLETRLAEMPLVGEFLVDRTAQEEALTPPAAHAVAGRLLDATIVVTLAATAVQSVTYAFSVVALGNATLFDIDQDSGVFTWASATATAFAGVALVVLAYLQKSHRRMLAVLGAVCLYLSLDDAAALHERVGQDVRNDVLHTSLASLNGIIWPILFFPLLAFAFLAFMWLAARACTSRERRFIIVGLGLLVLAIGAEAIHGPIGAMRDIGDFRYYAEVTVEEGLELAGWIVLAGAAFSLLLRRLVAAVR